MFSKILFIQTAAFLLTLISATSVFADVKIKMRSTAEGGEASEYTTYIKGKRQSSRRAERFADAVRFAADGAARARKQQICVRLVVIGREKKDAKKSIGVQNIPILPLNFSAWFSPSFVKARNLQFHCQKIF